MIDLFMHLIKNRDDILKHISTFASTILDFSFIQIGAFDGLSHDIFYPLFINQNWDGLFVEPRQKHFNSLKRNYQNTPYKFENSAITNEPGLVNLYNFREEYIYSSWQEGCASLVPAKHKQLSQLPLSALSIEKAKGISLDMLLKKYTIQDLNLLVIDTEGYDFEILKQINFQTLLPDFIFYEHSHLGDQRETSFEFIRSKHYTLFIIEDNVLCISPQATRFD